MERVEILDKETFKNRCQNDKMYKEVEKDLIECEFDDETISNIIYDLYLDEVERINSLLKKAEKGEFSAQLGLAGLLGLEYQFSVLKDDIEAIHYYLQAAMQEDNFDSLYYIDKIIKRSNLEQVNILAQKYRPEDPKLNNLIALSMSGRLKVDDPELSKKYKAAFDRNALYLDPNASQMQ